MQKNERTYKKIKPVLLWAHFVCFMQGTLETLRNTYICITEVCSSVVESI